MIRLLILLLLAPAVLGQGYYGGYSASAAVQSAGGYGGSSPGYGGYYASGVVQSAEDSPASIPPISLCLSNRCSLP